MSRYPKKSNPKLTDQTIGAIAEAIRLGAYVETAVALAGVSKDSFYRWLKESTDEDSSSQTRKLSDAVKKAMAEAEMRDLAVIDRAAQSGEWTAAAWRLERKHPERWGRQARVQLEQSGADGKPIQIEKHAHLSQAEMDERLAKIYKRLGRFIANKATESS